MEVIQNRDRSIIDRMRGHKALVEEVLLSGIEEARKARAATEAPISTIAEDRTTTDSCDPSLVICTTTEDFHKEIAIRERYPGTGLWLLDTRPFQAWFDPDFCLPHAMASRDPWSRYAYLIYYCLDHRYLITHQVH